MIYDDSAIEGPIWAIVSASDCVHDYRCYLEQFPLGRYRAQAIEQLVTLNDADATGESVYTAALAVLQQQAHLGDRGAQFHFGKALYQGIGTCADRIEGDRWWQLAVLQEEPRALITRCRNLLDEVEGRTPERIEQALQLADRAAKLGEPHGLTTRAKEMLQGTDDQRDVAGAVELLEAALASGDAWAASPLVRLFLFDGTVKQNLELAAHYAEQALELGDGHTAYLLGFHLERRSEDSEARRQARLWFERGSELLDPNCLRSLGYLLLRGGDIPKEGAAGIMALKRAAALGDVGAMRAIGLTYLHGIDAIRNASFGARWLQRAYAAGDAPAAEHLARCYADGLGINRDPLAARSCAEFAAKRGIAGAQCLLAALLLEEDSEAQDTKSAIRWLELAVLQKNPHAMARLGRMLELGDGVPNDDRRAMALYRKAAEAGDVIGKELLATRLLSPSCADYDPGEAVQWLLGAVEQGSSHARYLIGTMFETGNGVEQDQALATSWFLAAAEDGHPFAMYEAGRALLFDQSGPTDTTAAVKWLERSLAAGVQKAALLLERAKKRISEPTTSEPEAVREEAPETVSGKVCNLRPEAAGVGEGR